MLASGTGLAPMVPLLHSITDNAEDETFVTLVGCFKTFEGIYLKTFLQEQARFWNVRTFFVLSQVSPGGGARGRRLPFPVETAPVPRLLWFCAQAAKIQPLVESPPCAWQGDRCPVHYVDEETCSGWWRCQPERCCSMGYSQDLSLGLSDPELQPSPIMLCCLLCAYHITLPLPSRKAAFQLSWLQTL